MWCRPVNFNYLLLPPVIVPPFPTVTPGKSIFIFWLNGQISTTRKQKARWPVCSWKKQEKNRRHLSSSLDMFTGLLRDTVIIQLVICVDASKVVILTRICEFKIRTWSGSLKSWLIPFLKKLLFFSIYWVVCLKLVFIEGNWVRGALLEVTLSAVISDICVDWVNPRILKRMVSVFCLRQLLSFSLLTRRLPAWLPGLRLSEPILGEASPPPTHPAGVERGMWSSQ